MQLIPTKEELRKRTIERYPFLKSRILLELPKLPRKNPCYRNSEERKCKICSKIIMARSWNAFYCNDCRKKMKKLWAREGTKRYRKKHKEWRSEKNKKKRRDYLFKKYHTDKKFREKHLQKNKRYYENNKHRIEFKTQYKKWRIEHREEYLMNLRRRRAKRNNCKEHFTLQEWEELKKKCNYMCLCCKKSEPEIKLTEDHIIPLIKNGEDNIENIQPLCRSCNSSKGSKIIDFRLLEIICV